MQTCDVCCEKYNSTFHRKLTCSKCNHECCRRCAQTYLLSTHDDAHCMKCKTKWSREFVDSWCSKVFRNTEYRKHREESLFLREQLYFQETQIIVERIVRIRVLREALWAQRDKMVHLNRTHADEALIRQAAGEFDQMYEELQNLENQHDNLTSETTRQFTRKCPTADCKGFMCISPEDEKNHYCGLCKRVYCDECNQLLTEGHVCDPETRSTFQLIQKDSRPCPKCGEMITKIVGGCDQMFCTGCKTAFSWRTGEIETGRIHNPHFFEEKRNEGNIGRELGDIPCGGLPSFRELREMGAPEMMVRYRIMLSVVERYFFWIGNATETDERRRHTQRYRIQYMANIITEKRFRQVIQQIDKKMQKDVEVRELFEMLMNCASDLLRQYVVHPEQHDIVWEQLTALVDMTNDLLRNSVWKRYNCVTPRLLYF